MSFARALPFRSDQSSLAVSIVKTSDSLTLRTDGTFDAFSNVHSDLITLDVDLNVDTAKLQRCLPSGLSVDDAVELVAIEDSIGSRRRIVLDRYDPSDQQLSFDLDPDLHAGKVELSVTAVLRKDIPAAPGFAHLGGSTLAAAEVATVWFDEPETPAGDTLEIRWADFTKDDALPDEHLFAVRMEERPVILLNSAIGYAHEILNSKGTHGAAARIRDATFATIIHQCWSAILYQAFSDVIRLGDVDPSTVMDELGTWQGQVIQGFARDFIPGESDTAAATERLVEQLQESGVELVLHATPDVLQRRFHTARGFSGLVAETDKFGAGN